MRMWTVSLLVVIGLLQSPKVFGCKDTDDECAGWAKSGECFVDPDFMLQTCRWSCGDCNGDKYRIFQATPKPPPICWDVSPSCEEWKDLCTSSKDYMHKYCNVTCGLCQPDESCSDEDTGCAGWAKTGECFVDPEFMLQSCPKSCGDCSGVKYQTFKKTEKLPPICWDVSLQCADWGVSACADSDYMKSYCNVTCGLCTRPSQTTETAVRIATTTATTPSPTTTTSTPTPAISNALTDWEHKGCTNNAGFGSQCFWLQAAPQQNSPKECAKKCSKSQVFALRDFLCCCYATLDGAMDKGKSDDSSCQTVCAGDPRSKCGGRKDGKSFMNVYGKVVKKANTCGVPRFAPKLSEKFKQAENNRRKNDGRIINGTPANAFSWPWMVSFQYFGVHFCGGSIISPRHVLTAAHCFKDFEKEEQSFYEIHIGSHAVSIREKEEQRLKIGSITVHPKYNKRIESSGHDIAIVELASAARYTDAVQPICLAEKEVDLLALCVVTGWGDMDASRNDKFANILQQLEVPIVPPPTCNSTEFYDGKIDTTMLCAGYSEGGKDSCQGDSGGPLVCRARGGNWVQHGVVSWGDGCAQKSKPGVYADVARFRTWILENMKV